MPYNFSPRKGLQYEFWNKRHLYQSERKRDKEEDEEEDEKEDALLSVSAVWQEDTNVKSDRVAIKSVINASVRLVRKAMSQMDSSCSVIQWVIEVHKGKTHI